MKIYIPFKVGDIGGTTTFTKNFSTYAIKSAVEITHDFCLDFDVMLVIANCPLRYVLATKILRKRIIQRLDGVHHPGGLHKKTYWLYNLPMMIIHNYLSDFVIYQSEFSRMSCQKMFGYKKKKYAIIFNGVKIEKFAITQTQKKPIRLVTYAKFRRLDQIKPLIESVKKLDELFIFDIYGSFSRQIEKNIKEDMQKYDNIYFRGKLSNEELIKKISTYDIFLFSDQSACPNSVLEALAAGLAICAFDRGSISEIIENGRNGEIIKIAANNPFKDAYPFQEINYIQFSNGIKKIYKNIVRYKISARKNAEERFPLDQMISQYLDLMNKLLKK